MAEEQIEDREKGLVEEPDTALRLYQRNVIFVRGMDFFPRKLVRPKEGPEGLPLPQSPYPIRPVDFGAQGTGSV